MTNWRTLTFSELGQLQGNSGVYVIYNLGKIVAIGRHHDLMGRLAAWKGTLTRTSQVTTGSRYIPSGCVGDSHVDYLKNFYARPADCVLKVKIDAAQSLADALVKRFNPEWTRREVKRAVSNRQARKTGKKAVTPRQVPTETLILILELAKDGRTNTAIAEILSAKGLKSWTGKPWSAASVLKFLESESIPEEYDAIETVADSTGKVLYHQGSRRRYAGPNMEQRFNPRVSYKPEVPEDTTGLTAMLEAT